MYEAPRITEAGSVHDLTLARGKEFALDFDGTFPFIFQRDAPTS
ncbi:lasso RiPP family leader peptide-containing protein [Pseudactinotalea sp. Z1748]